MNSLLERYTNLGQSFDPGVIKLQPSLRVNTLKISDKELVQRLTAKKVKLTKIPFLSHGYYYEAPFSLGSTPEYLQGHYYLQESAAQLPAEVLEPKLGETVLDMCAAPGGKTAQLAALMRNKGVIVALDIKKERLNALRNNLERMGVENTVIYHLDARKVNELGLKFDKILLDAPCSGNFVTDKSWFDRRRIKDFIDRSKLQKELVKSAVSVLKPGGVLVYATCSLEPEEDEEVIKWTLANFDITLKPVQLELSVEDNKMPKLWPHKTGTQGFFVAKLEKSL